MMNEILKRLIELGERLPQGLRSDWDGTNHYELTSSSREDDYWWLILSDLFRESDIPPQLINDKNQSPCDTEYGKRVGLIMDIAATLREALPALKESLEYQENVKEYCELAKEYKEHLSAVCGPNVTFSVERHFEKCLEVPNGTMEDILSKHMPKKNKIYEDEGGEFEATLNHLAMPHGGNGRDAIILCLKHDNPAPLDIAILAARKEIKDLKEEIKILKNQ